MKLKTAIYAIFFCFLFFVFDYISFFKASLIVLTCYLCLCLLFEEAKGVYILKNENVFSLNKIYCGLKLKTWIYLIFICYLLSKINPHLSENLSFYNSLIILSIFVHTSVWLLIDYKVYAKDKTAYYYQLRSAGVDPDMCIQIIHNAKN